ncbi:hypothetical protein UFOVP1387_33 [uncultured Caudovirales phage]|uniref:PA14 domain containing protein n=1 Tax=uncultured Caudovirales phage TaxID=2100421 RepID=A0A6J5S647_9CAUD|nr:hypothetical protein UFOVP1387_33 [uncultured Caudovirales phage]
MIIAPALVLSLWPSSSATAVQTGLAVTGYTIDQIPPVKSDDVYPVCGQGTLDFINATWDYTENEFGACGSDLFMLHYTGSLQIPEHQTIEFWVASDDGGTVQIGTHAWGVWQDQGCSATESGQIDISAGTQPVDAWFYENGGGTCFMLAWNIDGAGWSIVPPEAFTSIPMDTTTTTDQTTTTVLEVSTTALPPTTQATPSNTTTTSDQTTSTTTTTTTSTTTTSTTIPTPPPTAAPPPPVIEMLPPDPEPSPPDTDAAPPDTVSLPPDTEPEPPETVPVDDNNNEVTPEVIAALAVAIDEITSIAPESITPDQITEIVESAAFDLLSDQQVAEIAAVISDAPDEVKDTFESAVNVFDDPALSAYVPKGSVVSVAVRRAIIAVTAVTMAMSVPMPTASSTSSADRSRKLQ